MANPCPYCGDHMPNARRKQCGKADCKRLHRNQNQRAFQQRYRAEHGAWYARHKHGDAQRAYMRQRYETLPHWRVQYPERAASYDARRRMRMEQARTSEAFAPLDVHTRDRCTCQLCLLPIDPDVAWPDRMSASVDHIVPLSRGGQHSMSNVQGAHLGCNSSKGDRPAVRRDVDHDARQCSDLGICP